MIQARAAFRYPNYRYYMSARFLTPLASEMQAVAVAWQVYGLTHRPLDLGLVGLAQFLPGIFLFLAAGHTADRVPRLRILQTCLAAFSLCSVLLLALTVRGLASVYPIYAVLLLNGAVRAFNGPAGQAFLPLLVPEEGPLTRHAGVTMLWCVFGFGLFTVVFGLSHNLALSLAALALAGACDMVSVIVRQTMIQLSMPDEMRGRVSAVNMMFVGASNEE